MTLDTKSTVSNAIYSANEMSKMANTTQVKRYSDANTSFATAMRTSAEEKETKETVNETKDTSVDKTEKKDDSKKTDNKNNEKVTSEQKYESDTLQGEVSSENNQAQNNEQNLNQGQGNNQQNEYTPLTNQIQAYMNANGLDVNFICTNPMNAVNHSQISGMVTTVDYTTVKMSDNDAKFFADLVSKTDMSAANVAAEFDKALQNENIKMVQSTAKASTALIEALKESAKNHQSFRVDFDKDISVILQVDKGGKINANFIPGDKAVEAYLKNNIEFLRQRFNEENIAYGDINYSQSRRNKEERERNNHKERAHE